MAKSPKSVSDKAILPPADPSSRAIAVDYFVHTDQGNVQRFIDAFGTSLRYDHLRGQWLVWVKHYWEPVMESAVMRRAAALIRKRREECKVAGHKQLEDWMHFCESGNHIREMVSRARYERPISVEVDVWNKNPWLLAVQNGVIDLRTGKLGKGNLADYVTLHSSIKYDPTATCPRYDRFLAEIFLNRDDLIRYVSRALGYSLTGSARERCLFICWGSGNNGKGALFDIMEYVLGDYAATTPASTFARARNEHAPRNDLARLVSIRCAIAQETDLKGGVAEAILKNITGKDTITCRFLHKEFFQYKPEFTFWLSCNNRPPIQGTDDAIWRRLPLIPFEAVFVGDGEEKNLDIALRAEAPGILNRLIQNCLDWQLYGLGEQPECVNQASTDYRSESNPVAEYLEMYCDCAFAPEGNDGVGIRELWESYAEYMRKLHQKPVGPVAFKTCLEALGYRQGRTNCRRFWNGINILDRQVDYRVSVD